MSEYAKNIQTIEDLWKKRIGLPKLTEIVRCRDCKHYDESDAGCSYFVLAKNKLLHIGNPDGFCAWAERREL